MKRLFPLTACLFAAATAHAAPYCAELTNADALPKKYARSAPIFSDDATGWVFTQDQLKDRYDMKSTSRALVGDIVEEFAKRDVALAIAVSPPRPIVAGQATLDAAMGSERYDLGTAEASFAKLIDGLAATGAIVPNLVDTALANHDTQEAFYFRRDTHWTTTGSALTAIALAEATNAIHPDLFPSDGAFAASDLVVSGEIEEEGSLAMILREVCGANVPAETAAAFDLSRGSASDLLGDASDGPSIALVGSSFSDRYKRDHYRFGDALARAFEAEVENYSVSGGGAIGAIEAYVLSGALDRREHELVVWEIPYTESFNSTSFLRQLLGALRLPHHDSRVQAATSLSTRKTSVDLSDAGPLAGIEVISDDPSQQDFRLEVQFDNGSKSKIALRRKSAVPPEMRGTSLYVSFDHFGDRSPTQVLIEGKKDASVATINVFAGM